MQSKADVLLYNTREMKSQGNYIAERLLTSEYCQGWRFQTRWAGYRVSDDTYEPVKVFVHADGKLNELFVEFCLAGAAR